MNQKNWLALGLMSGTSYDGVDASLIETDGIRYVKVIKETSLTYTPKIVKMISKALRGKCDMLRLEKELTLAHVQIVNKLLSEAKVNREDVDVIGFHGHTTTHRPEEGITNQIGDAALLTSHIKINVVADFRRADMAFGGQGAPLVPVYHAAIINDYPSAVVNIGGVANITILKSAREIFALDTGPGNALMDDIVRDQTDQLYDKDGKLARKGTINEEFLQTFLDDPYFEKRGPKSLDRDYFKPHYHSIVRKLDLNDSLATFASMTARSIALAIEQSDVEIKTLYLTGGGRKNKFLVSLLKKYLNIDIRLIDDLGYDGDMLEAQAFAYLAVRSLLRLHATFPTTTGVSEPVCAGALYRVYN